MGYPKTPHITGEYQGGTSSIDPCSRRSSKNRIFEAALCLYMYLVCAREEHPTSTCATLSAFFRNEGGFPFRKLLGVFFVALRNFFEALDHTLVYGAGAFSPKVTDFIRPWRAPVAILGQDFDHFRYFESPFVTCRWWYLLVEGDLHFLQSGRVLVPSPSLLLQLYPKPACLFNVFKHFRIISSTSSRIFISCSLILWVPLQHLTQIRKPSSRDRVKLLVNYTRDLLFLFPVKPTF